MWYFLSSLYITSDFSSPLNQILRINLFKVAIKVNKGDQVLAEHCRGGQRHQNLVLSPVRRDLSDLDEPPSLILLHIQIESLVLEAQSPRGQIPLHPNWPLITAGAIRIRHDSCCLLSISLLPIPG